MSLMTVTTSCSQQQPPLRLQRPLRLPRADGEAQQQEQVHAQRLRVPGRRGGRGGQQRGLAGGGEH